MANLLEWNISNSTILYLFKSYFFIKSFLPFHRNPNKWKLSKSGRREILESVMTHFLFNFLNNGGNEDERVSEQEHKADHMSFLSCSHSLSQQLPHRSQKILFPSLLQIQHVWRSAEWSTTGRTKCGLFGNYTGCHMRTRFLYQNQLCNNKP